MMIEKKEGVSLTEEQKEVLKNKSKRLVVSASAGSGKTFVVVEKLSKLICEEHLPLSRLLVLTFTKAAASELKSRLFSKMLESTNKFVLSQLDEVALSDISTIDAFCEKLIKRNVNFLSLPPNFAILDEKSSQNLKKGAFLQTFEEFSLNFPQEFENIYFAFKRNKETLFECMTALQSFFDSLAEGEKLQEDFGENTAVFEQKACEFLLKKMREDLSASKKYLAEGELLAGQLGGGLPQKHAEFVGCMRGVIECVDFSLSYFEICKILAGVSLPSISTAKVDGEVKEKLVTAKELVEGWTTLAKDVSMANEEMLSRTTALAEGLMKMFGIYSCKYAKAKEKRSALDFADLEKYAKKLLQNDDVKASLQEKYDYIVIDEYQDTNRLQESILKPIAEGGYFVAVGDIKQGIYGFRNASKEIMGEDIKEFSSASDGSALFLRGNFRTDKNILDFVNRIFEKLMTKESVGIDYKNTSMLEGLNHFQPDALPPVCVDVVLEEEKKKVEENFFEEIYSVKDAPLKQDYKYKNEVLAIASRIEEVLTGEIYQPKTKTFRRAKQGDIALLFRGRSALMEECIQFLRGRGFSVSADIKESLIDDSEIAVLVSLLKLTINPTDDIPLASAMASHFGGFGIEELAQIREIYFDDTFANSLQQCKERGFLRGKIEAFENMLATIKFNIYVYGITQTFKRLFAEYDYYNYISSLADGREKRERLNRFFALIRSLGLDNKPQEVVESLEGGDKEGATFAGGNSITITTIHATKGLEYPVVILCGAGENLSKVYNKNYIASKDFGLGTYLYEYEDNLRVPLPTFTAGKMALKNREMVDEIMLFYVALTRAQNHLYIIGRGKKRDFSFKDLEKQNSYLKQIFFALGQNLTSQFFEEEGLTLGGAKLNLLTEFIEESPPAPIGQIKEEATGATEKLYQFEYENFEDCKISFKNSVTAVARPDEDRAIGETLFEEVDEGAKIARERAVEIGNSYHQALKLLNFENVKDLPSLVSELEKIKPFMTEGYFENIDISLLLKNILLIKGVASGKVFKEREFIMSCPPHEVFGGCERGGEVIVQGIVDFFSVADKIVLVDYKYTSTKDKEKLIARYAPQLDLYEKALTKAFEGRRVEKYLLSLKEGKLIKIQ